MNNDMLFKFDKDTQTITDYDVLKGGTDVRVPYNIEGVDVLHIGDMAFYNKGLTSLVLPDNLLSIGEGSFAGNHSMTVHVNTDIKIETGSYFLDTPSTWNVGNKSKSNKGYNQKEYRGILSDCGLDEDNLPDGVRVEGTHGDWWIVDSRTTYDAVKGHYNVKLLGFNNIHVYIVCPNCKMVHWHGAPEKDRESYLGLRSPHCIREVPKKLSYNILKE